VIRIVVDVDFAAVIGNAVAILVASEASRDGAEPAVGAAIGGRLRERARNAGVRGASRLRFRLGYALVATELLIRRAFLIL
jgi:hypothetical protein